MTLRAREEDDQTGLLGEVLELYWGTGNHSVAG